MDKVAIITGSSSLIGLAIIKKIAKEYKNLVLHYNSESSLELLKDFTKDYDNNFLFIQANIANEEECKNIIVQTKKEFKRVDCLINSAGITKDKLLLTMKTEDFKGVMETNMYGTFYMTRGVLPLMSKQKSGVIICVSSVIGIIGNAGQSNYAASKAAIIGFSKSVAKEYASRNIRVNVIAPGFIKTAMTAVLNEEVKNAVLENIPLKKFGEPEDVANLVNFLISEEASYITGQVIKCDGGMVI